MFTSTIQKTYTDETDESTFYSFTASAETLEEAESLVCIYASMVEYGIDRERWMPNDLPFPREQLYQFIQPSALENIEAMYENAIPTAYSSAYAYVQSYVGAMFDIDDILANGGTSSTSLTLRLALCISTATFVLASSPQYSEVIEVHNKQLHYLLRGLKSGQRNFGKDATIGDPDIRIGVVSLTSKTKRP